MESFDYDTYVDEFSEDIPSSEQSRLQSREIQPKFGKQL